MSSATHAMRIRAHKQGVEKEEASGDDDGGVVKGLEERRRAKAAAAASKEESRGAQEAIVEGGILKMKRSGSQSRVQFDDGVGGGGSEDSGVGGGGGGAGADGASTATGIGEPRRVQRESTDRRFEGLAALEAEARTEPAEFYPNEEEEAY